MNDAWAWFLGVLTPVWVISGFESSSTLAEEASNAARVVPFAMVSSIITSLVIGEGIIIALMFNMGQNISALLESPFGQPVGQIIYNGLGRGGAVTLYSFLVFGSSLSTVRISRSARLEKCLLSLEMADFPSASIYEY